MEPHKVVSHDEWIAARKAYLAEEKASRKRATSSPASAARCRGKRSKRITCSTVRTARKPSPTCSAARASSSSITSCSAPAGKQGCPSCSYLADHFDGAAIHLAQRDVSFVVVSRAPLPEIETFQKRMGWKFKWVSSFGSDFNHDYQVSVSPEEKAAGTVMYNYEITTFPSDERPGASVFFKDAAGSVFHTYSTYGRGLDIFIGAYNFLDIAPKGRDEEGLRYGMAWVRHHDRYEGAVVDTKASYQQPKSASCCD